MPASGTYEAVRAVWEDWLARHVHEIPDHSNRTEIGVAFGWNGVAWCCESNSVAFKRAGVPAFWTASVWQAIQWAKQGKNGLRWIPREQANTVPKGACATFDWQLHTSPGNTNNFHISWVVDPFSLRTAGLNGKFHTYGGNENDAVTDQWRDCQYVQGWIVPAYLDAQPTPQPPPQPPKDWFDMASQQDLVDAVATRNLDNYQIVGEVTARSKGERVAVNVLDHGHIWAYPLDSGESVVRGFWIMKDGSIKADNDGKPGTWHLPKAAYGPSPRGCIGAVYWVESGPDVHFTSYFPRTAEAEKAYKQMVGEPV